MVPVSPIYLLAPEVVIMSVVCNIEIIRIFDVYLIYLLAPEVVIMFVVCNIEVIYDIFVNSALLR